MNKTTTGHIAALITIVIWGTTFISTKILLVDFTPIEILFLRFLLGLLVLIIVYPKRLRLKDRKQELTFAVAGLCGICLYYLLENIALTYTMASNVGVIISIAPFFTAVLSHIFMKTEEKLKVQFFFGFFVAMVGIYLISFNGRELELNPIGDILAVVAALVWSVYSLLTRKISRYGYNTVQTTRRIFTYGIVFMLPFLFVFDFNLDIQKVAKPEYTLNLIYLGIGASALCFVTWNYAVKMLGAVKTSVYIYMVPVITVATSVIVLKEKITWVSAIGTVLILIGLFLSESRLKIKKRGKENECGE
ncbi:MAG: DMT family transporter [Eubacterium sp.]